MLDELGSTQIPRRLVITGAPGSGKTTIIEALREHLSGKILCSPEWPSGFINSGLSANAFSAITLDPTANASMVEAIVTMRVATEAAFHKVAQLARLPLVVFDRGLGDCAAYPNQCEQNTSGWVAELAQFDALERYDAVIQLGLPQTVEHYGRQGGATLPTWDAAQELQARLSTIWNRHRNYYFIPGTERIQDKLSTVMELILLQILNRSVR